VDTDSFLSVYDEVKVSPDQVETWKHDKQGALVGRILAHKMGWKVGDHIVLQSGIYPGDWQMNVDGIYATTARSMDEATLLFHWDYVNDSLPAARKDNVGWIVSRVDDPKRVADISVALDKSFEERETPTLSQDEGSFNASFQAMFSAVLQAMDIISAVILLIMTLILGNTIAMGVRERTSEYGVLRAIGFLPKHVAIWILGESLVTGILGGALGLAIAWPLINVAFARFVEENLSGMIRYFHLNVENVLLGFVLSAMLGVVAAVIPAWRAMQLHVVDAVRRVA
jgi:putative ABC transport system permease protein